MQLQQQLAQREDRTGDSKEQNADDKKSLSAAKSNPISDPNAPDYEESYVKRFRLQSSLSEAHVLGGLFREIGDSSA